MYQALYRKWRPKSFDDVVGQEHITTTLRNEIAAGKPAHAYLLMGSRGTGKTTCAKLIAKAVNCLAPKDGSPCGECEICKGIDNGSMVDVVEIDAASNNGVDNIRDLREEANFLPNVTKYRVYIIDEVHMLSMGAVNALLKIMEEPPSHVIFILATTEVHKIPATIQSRCQRFDFKRIDSAAIAGRLRYVSDQEGISITDEALAMIARLADGGMRDALSLLDLCSSHSHEVTLETVSEAAGLIGQDYLFDIADAVSRKDLSAALDLIGVLGSQAVEYDRLCQQLVTHYRNLLMAATSKNPGELIVCLPETLERYKTQAAAFTPARLVYAISALQQASALMSRTTSRRTELELCLARLCDPRLDQSPQALLARIDQLEAKLNRLLAEGVTLPAEVSQSQQEEAPAKPQKEKKAARPSPSPAPPSQPAVPMERWGEVMDRLKIVNPALRGALTGSRAFISGSRVLIDFPNPVFRELMNSSDDVRVQLKRAIAEVTGTRYGIGPYDPPKEQTPEQQVNPLDELLAAAADSGIEIKTM